MAIQTAALDLAVDGLAGNVTQLSLHSADGGASGTAELTGGSYSRQAPTYAASSAASADVTADVTFGGPGSSTLTTHVGFWDGATWLGSAALTDSKTLTSSDLLVVTSAPITATA